MPSAIAHYTKNGYYAKVATYSTEKGSRSVKASASVLEAGKSTGKFTSTSFRKFFP